MQEFILCSEIPSEMPTLTHYREFLRLQKDTDIILFLRRSIAVQH